MSIPSIAEVTMQALKQLSIDKSIYPKRLMVECAARRGPVPIRDTARLAEYLIDPYVWMMRMEI
jgi:hypothetical protein